MSNSTYHLSAGFQKATRWLTLFCLALLSLAASSQSKTPLYKASHPAFNYMGRVDFPNPDVARYDWSGVEVRFQFTGSQLSLFFKGGDQNYFNLFVDGKLKEVLHSPGDTVVHLPGIKGKGPHEAIFYKRTEGGMGITSFYGAEPASDGKIMPCPKTRERRLEFIGNSITCGYGTEGASKNEAFRPETENSWKAYGAIIARAFNADFHLISHSGLGVVRNYGDEKKISTKKATMPDRYHQTLDTDPTLSWDFSAWQPHAVVINLGTNDFSTHPHPDKLDFQRRYGELIEQIHKNYGEIPVFCVVGPMIDEPCNGYVRELVDKRRKQNNDENIHFKQIPENLLNSADDWGSDWHPSYKGQQKMADYVLPLLKSVLGWEN